MSKSKPQETTATTDTSQMIPQWLEDAGQRAVSRGEDLSNRPYTQYSGEMVAPQSPDTTLAYQQVRDMQGQGSGAFTSSLGAYGNLVGQAAPITASGVNANTNSLYSNFQQGPMAQAQGLLGGYAASGPATAQQVGQNASTLMSPYAQNVIDPTLRAGEQARQIARQTVAGNANNLNAFGGSRQGVVEGVSDAQNALGTQQQIGNMLNTGWGQALTSGTNIGLQAGAQGYGAATGLANLGATGYQNAAQAGQGISNTNLASGLTAAAGLPGVATAQQGYGQKDASLLQAIGADQQNYGQRVDNAAYGQFLDEQNYPIQSLDMLLGTMGGIPYSTTGQGLNTQKQNLTKNVGGGILGGALSGATTGAAVSGGNPYVAAGGAIIGGISGALG